MKNWKFTSTGEIKRLASLKLTTICLLILTVLVVWGTVYQASHGLYQAQQKFFHAWFFFIFGIIPFPGTVIILWILAINLIAALIWRIGLRWKRSGLFLIHLGIVVLLLGGFFAGLQAVESSISLQEGEETRLSVAYQNWEIAVWQQSGTDRTIYAADTDNLNTKDQIDFSPLGIHIKINRYYRNCDAFLNQSADLEKSPVNGSGISVLKEKSPFSQPAQNIPGMIFTLLHEETSPVLLYGRDTRPTTLQLEDRTIMFLLRKKRYLMPFSIKLTDFKKTTHPGTDMAKSYRSQIVLKTGTMERAADISMNKPLRYKDYSLFQSSYFVAKDGTEFSVFAVVRNSFRLFPYLSSGIIFLGLLIHFLVMLIGSRKSTNKL